MPDDSALARETIRRVTVRLIPFLFVLYIFNFLDRTNVAIAALQMNRDLRFSASAYGLGAGIFFIGYALFEVPSNLILARVGARRWIARIMISWGLIAAAMMFVRTPMHFYVLRFLLGVAEAGFFPGMVFYLSEWFPAVQRARALARFMIAIPLSAAVGNPLSVWLLGLDGRAGLAGWQWLFLLEGIPSVLLGVIVLLYLTDRPAAAHWLSPEQRDWLVARLKRDGEQARAHGLPPLRALLHPVIWMSALIYFLALTTGYSYILWGPTLIRDALQTSNAATGLISGAIAAAAALVMLAISASSDRFGERFVHAAAAIAIGALACVAAALAPTPLLRIVGLGFIPVGVYGFLGPFWCLPTKLLSGTAAAVGIAFINSVGNVGGFVGPYSLGLLKDATGGTSGAFLGLAVFMLAGSGMCLVLRAESSRAGRALKIIPLR